MTQKYRDLLENFGEANHKKLDKLGMDKCLARYQRAFELIDTWCCVHTDHDIFGRHVEGY